jgi:hypothetical protein
MAALQSELTVITKAKELCRYVMAVTEKSPKRFRFTLVSRMQNLALDVIDNAYRANDIYTAAGREEAVAKRLDLQHAALTAARLLGYMALLAREQNCILPKQFENITKLVSDCQNLLGAWIASDRKRNKGNVS